MKTKSGIKDNYIQDYREKIGMRIRLLREEKNLSQDELAKIMQVHRSTISKIETGKFAITIDYLIRFGWVLDFNVILEPIENTIK